ncbi:unnamed protein product [Rotaria magnacalcarata]|uniref:UAS domain-containing protein n=5 Tax=Rotaria magnacalcarata TaxID=392030 RepID=A0A815ITA5_9BILA|nr:unnamed protein product [Rotaria magnacalcarata]CAF1370009.1 unnamed protein product [Rotaria magnacalcarata]CAF2142517.1 unnamed protein product [Rotaria magnacalcarata]
MSDDDDGSEVEIDIKSDDENNDVLISPMPKEYENETVAIESFNKYFGEHYNDSPAFFMGSLQQACDDAFSSKLMIERRPVLVYIHNEVCLNSEPFCKTIFSSTNIIEYLLQNYFVWPWDVTFESNRSRLEKVWIQMFSTELDSFNLHRCPMLIGIKRLFVEHDNGSLVSQYQFKILLQDDILQQTGQKVDRGTLRNELTVFKQECDDNERALFQILEFINKNKDWEKLFPEICNYLTLNDAIEAFSTNILPLLRQNCTKVMICDPSETFINMILRKIKPEQVTSLCLNMSWLLTQLKLDSLHIFPNVTSLTVMNFQQIDAIDNYTAPFPKLKCLSLWYDYEISFKFLNIIFEKFQSSINEFRIHCAGAVCDHSVMDTSDRIYAKKSNIKYFLFDMGQFPLTSMNNCLQHCHSWFIQALFSFIKVIYTVRCVRLIINCNDAKILLDINEWRNLICTCSQLRKITLEVFGSQSPDVEVSQKIVEIRHEIFLYSPGTKFCIIFK